MKSLHGMVSDPNNEWVKIHHDYGQDINARQVALSALKGDADGFVRLRAKLKEEIDDLKIRRTTAQIMAEQRFKQMERDK